MDIENFSKLKILFSTDKNDMRSIFFLLAVSNMINLSCKCLYDLPYMIGMDKNEEWITYCRDLMLNGNMVINSKIGDIYVDEFTECLNPWEYELITMLFTIESIGHTFMKIQLDKDKFTDFCHVKFDPTHVKSDEKQFEFNESILKAFLKSIMQDIPEMKDINIDINPIKKCFTSSDQLKITFQSTFNKCVGGKSVDDCIDFMKSTGYNEKILNEVKTMDICEAAKILVKLGFISNNGVSFEKYSSWEKRTTELLYIGKVNPQLKKYIELLLDKVNPISILKNELQSKIGFSISHILKEFIPEEYLVQYNKVEDKFHKAHYIITLYAMLMNVFNNRNIFNYDNMFQYRILYDKINYKYLSHQDILLNQMEDNLINQIKKGL